MPYFIRPYFISETERARLAALDRKIIRRAAMLALASIKARKSKDSPNNQNSDER